MNPSRAMIQPFGRALLLTGMVSGMLLMAGHSPAGEGPGSGARAVRVEQSLGEWAPQALSLEPASGLVERSAPVQRWVF